MPHVAASAWWIENICSGHQVPILPVKISNASAGVRFTVTDLRTGSRYGAMLSTLPMLSPRGRLAVRLLRERREGVLPEPVQVLPQLLQAAHLDAEDPARPFLPGPHEPRSLEHLQVLGDRRAGHVEPLREPPHRLRPAPQPLEDLAARWIG